MSLSDADLKFICKPRKSSSALEIWIQTVYDDEERRVIVKSDLEVKGAAKKIAVQHYDQLGRVRLSRTIENPATEDPTNEQHGIKVQTRYAYDDPIRFAPFVHRLSEGFLLCRSVISSGKCQTENC